METYHIMAHWDAEAKVWWAESNDVKGLVAEAETVEGLLDDLRHVVPELLHLNQQIASPQSVTIRLTADRTEEGVHVTI
jgi:predicted RNase H-like HicB family nuclease